MPPSLMNKLGGKGDQELLYKGVFLVLIGLGVLLSPHFMGGAGLREVVASSALVGWFALVLGGAFLAQYGLKRRAAHKTGPPNAG